MQEKQFEIVIVSGGFDPVHVGHIRMILAAASISEAVIIGVNSDEWLKRKKGYIFMPQEERIEVVRSIKGVRYATTFDDSDNSAKQLITKIREKYPRASIAFANGGDRTKDNIPEIEVAEKNYVKLIWNIGGRKIQSSSELVNNTSKKENLI